MARHAGRLKLGLKPAQLYIRLNILPLSQQSTYVSSRIIRHFVVAFACLHFALPDTRLLNSYKEHIYIYIIFSPNITDSISPIFINHCPSLTVTRKDLNQLVAHFLLFTMNKFGLFISLIKFCTSNKIYIYICIFIHMCIYIYIYIHMTSYIYTYTSISSSLSFYIYIYMYIHIYIYIYTHTFIYIYKLTYPFSFSIFISTPPLYSPMEHLQNRWI